MSPNNLVLFGKHPAWSDHMFISDNTAVSHYLKRVFYDHSVIPALQGGDGDKRISETWSFLVIIEGHTFFIANAISRDSVGRRRFPLIVAYPLPEELKLGASLDALRELKGELLSLLDEMLEPPSENLDEWQEAVTQKIKSFRSALDWSKIDSVDLKGQLKRDKAQGLISRLVDDYDAFDLKHCEFSEACSFIQLGLNQFKVQPPAMLILDQEEKGAGLLFATEDGTSFNLKRYLYNNLTSLAVSVDNIPPKVSRALKSAGPEDAEFISIDQIPSLKLSIHQSLVSRKFLVFSISLLVVISILFGLFYSSLSDDSCPEESSETTLSAREQWTSNATAYVEWVQPLVGFVDEQSAPISDFDSVTAALDSDLDPFVAVAAKEASMKLARNPLDQFLDYKNAAKLETVYANIDHLKTSLNAYYKKQFSDELVKELKRQNYPVPSFIKIDFSQQPLLPDFGPKLTNQLEAYMASRNLLIQLVTETKVLWDSIIKPLHQVCPEHAKYIQRYVQHLMAESENFEQFQKEYISLIELFGYPDFIQVNAVDFSELSEDAQWNGVLEKERSLESLHELIKLLEDNHADHHQSHPGAMIEKVKVIEEQALSAEEQIQFSGINLDQWDSFFTASLQELQDDRLVAAIKNHEKAMRMQMFKDAAQKSPPTLPVFKERVNELITAFRRLDSSSIKEVASSNPFYLESEQGRQRLSDYMFAEYTAANVATGDVASVSQLSQGISLSVDNYLAELNQSFAELETIYFGGSTNKERVDLTKKIAEVTENPLYVDGLFGSRMKIVTSTAANSNALLLDTADDLAWYVEALLSKGEPDETHLAVITEAFNALNPTDQTSELSSKLLAAFDSRVQGMRTNSPESLLEFYKNLDVYLPQKLHTQQHKDFKEVATYSDRSNRLLNGGQASKEELVRLRDSAKSPVTQMFYTGLLEQYDEMSAQTSESVLDKIEKVSGVESISISDDFSRVEVIFEGTVGKLVFLPIKKQSETVFVQQSPLTLSQYIQLSNICDFDTEYYLTLQDSFWPRSFEVGMGFGFSTLREWQFRNKDAFSSVSAFSKNNLPAHLNEPREVLRMAEFFGFRLLKPEECADFISLADRSSINRLEIIDADRASLVRANTIQSSVYAESIARRIEQGTWTGGIDFERGTPGGSQFFDSVGGSAELAYDGVDFYAVGGSWLYEPAVLEEPVKITEQGRMYIDLGIRFAMNIPTQRYSFLVQKLALKLLAEIK